jgi:uncharacterized membrane protein
MVVFDNLLIYVKDTIALMGVVVIVVGAVRAFYQLISLFVNQQVDPNSIRLTLGQSVILGLEFMVGADIIGSLVEPTYYNVGLLAIIVLIRTTLSYFLNVEIETLSHHIEP